MHSPTRHTSTRHHHSDAASDTQTTGLILQGGRRYDLHGWFLDTCLFRGQGRKLLGPLLGTAPPAARACADRRRPVPARAGCRAVPLRRSAARRGGAGRRCRAGRGASPRHDTGHDGMTDRSHLSRPVSSTGRSPVRHLRTRPGSPPGHQVRGPFIEGLPQ